MPVISPPALQVPEPERLDLAPRERDHERLRSASRATSRSSNGVTTPADVLALLVPLAGDHDHVALVRERHRARDRAAPVGVDLDVERPSPGARPG